MNQRTIGKLVIDNSAGYTFSGGTVTLKSSTGPLVSVLSGQHVIASRMVLDTSSSVDTSLAHN